MDEGEIHTFGDAQASYLLEVPPIFSGVRSLSLYPGLFLC